RMVRQTLTGRIDLPPRIDSAPAIGLEWLVRLRWGFAVATVIVAAAARLLRLPADEVLTGAACSVILLTNAGLRAWSKKGRPASSVLLASILVLDGVLLTIALRASGGSMNPFSVLYLVHVALAALLLDGAMTWLVAGATCLGFGALFLRPD